MKNQLHSKVAEVWINNLIVPSGASTERSQLREEREVTFIKVLPWALIAT